MMVDDKNEAAGILSTSEDAFLGGRITIRQPKAGPRAGIDAVFLAAACPAQPGETVLEAGSGSGIVSLAVARRVPGVTVTGVEIDPSLAALSRSNAEANGLSSSVRFMEGDVTAPSSAFSALGLSPASFDHVLANPPFLAAGEARLPPHAMLRRAHAAEPEEWDGWLRFLAAFARPRGMLNLIHRVDALPRLLPLLNGRFGSVVLYPLFPRPDAPATRLIIRGMKGSRGAVQIRQGMVLHRAEGGFTDEAEAILRHGAPLDVEAANTHLLR
jgi:tRNA1(Val) A37 N6-methylase TrmN6